MHVPVAIVLALTAVAAPAALAAPESAPFTDVPADSLFAADITWLVDRGVTTGYPDGTFRPTAPVTRQQFAAFLYRYDKRETGASCPGDAPFRDVPADSGFCEAVQWLVASGVTSGYSDGTFRPTETITRQQIVAFLYRVFHEGARESACGSTSRFSDVDPAGAACSAIEWAAALSPAPITVGYSDGTFRPSAATTRQAVAAYLHHYDADFPEASLTGDWEPAPSTTELSPADVREVTGDPLSGGSVTLEPGAAAPAVGEPVVVRTDEPSRGVAGRVRTVSSAEDGSVTVQLEPAPLRELFSRIEVDVVQSLDVPSSAAPESFGALGFGSAQPWALPRGALECKDVLEGDGTDDEAAKWDFDATLRFERSRLELQLEEGSLVERPHMRTHFYTEIVLEVRGAAQVATECKLSDQYDRLLRLRFPFMAGPVPVSVEVAPAVTFKVQAAGEASFTARSPQSFGFAWKAGSGVTSWRDGSVIASGEATLEPELEIGLGTAVAVKLFASSGVELKAAIVVQAQRVADEPCIELSDALKIEGALVADIWFKELSYKFWDAEPFGEHPIGDPLCTPLVVVTDSLPEATEGAAYEATVQASGGLSPYTWTTQSLPSGLELSPDGRFSGTPESAGSHEVTIGVTDSRGRTATRVLRLVVNSAPPEPSKLYVVRDSGPGRWFRSGFRSEVPCPATPSGYSATSIRVDSSGATGVGHGETSPGALVRGSAAVEFDPATASSATFTVQCVAQPEAGSSAPEAVTYTFSPFTLTATGDMPAPTLSPSAARQGETVNVSGSCPEPGADQVSFSFQSDVRGYEMLHDGERYSLDAQVPTNARAAERGYTDALVVCSYFTVGSQDPWYDYWTSQSANARLTITG